MCASIIACGLAIGSGRPATASGVAILGACSRSGHVADAQVGEIPGFARLPPPPGWRITSPLVIVSADGGGAGAALRRGIISFIGPIGQIGILRLMETVVGFLGRTFGTHSYIYA